MGGVFRRPVHFTRSRRRRRAVFSAATVGTNYDETGRALTLLVQTGESDLQGYRDTGQGVMLLALLGETDLQAYRDTGAGVLVLAQMGGSDLQAYRDTGL